MVYSDFLSPGKNSPLEGERGAGKEVVRGAGVKGGGGRGRERPGGGGGGGGGPIP